MKQYPENSILETQWHSAKPGYPKPENGQWCHIVVEFPKGHPRAGEQIITKARFSKAYVHEGVGSNPDMFHAPVGVRNEIITYEPLHEGCFVVLAWTPEVGIPFPESLE